MHSPARQLVAIAQLTATEAVRAPVYAAGFLALLLAAGMLPVLDYLALLEKRALVVDSLRGLSLSGGSFVAMLLAIGVIGREFRSGTVALLLTRPIAVWAVLLGKLVGLALALLPLAVSLGLGLLWGSRTAFDAYVTDRIAGLGWFCTVALAAALALLLARPLRGFGAALALVTPVLLAVALAGLCRLDAAGRPGHGGWLVDWSLLRPAMLIWPGMVLAAAVAGVAALRLEPIAALVVALLVFAVGLGGGPVLVWPNWQVFAPDAAPSWLGVARGYGYAAGYGLALALLASRLPGLEEPA